MKSEIEKLREQRKEIEQKMKKVEDYVSGHTYQYAKGKQIKIVDKRADILAHNAKVALHKLTDLLDRKRKQIDNEIWCSKELNAIMNNYEYSMWYYYIKERRKEGRLN